MLKEEYLSLQDVLEKLQCKINQIQGDAPEKIVLVGIGGPGGLGKSFLATRLCEVLDDCVTLCTDSLSMNRAERTALGIVCSDDPKTGCLSRLEDALRRVVQQSTLSLLAYDHKEGKVTRGCEVDLSGVRVLIIDGAQIMHNSLSGYFHLRVLLTANDDVVRQLRRVRDVCERGYTLDQFDQLWSDYKSTYAQHYREYERNADIVLNVSPGRFYTRMLLL